MQSFKFTVKDEKGIHARPAGEITAVAKKYKADSYIIYNGKKFDLKNLFTFIGSELAYKDSIEVFVSGPDEIEAIKELEKAFNSNL